jgi:hypothetical protein
MHPEYFIFVVLAIAVGSFIYRSVKYGGFKSGMFGAHIERTLGEVENGEFTKMRLVVHTLSKNEKHATVGLELVATNMGAYRIIPIPLTTIQAQKLITLLQSAIAADGH